ncbi:MAG: YggT family protein [Thermodesulfovibrionales bacterium]|nr:YggT family protein [Thermodesulfovibrionales bacterium]
MFILGNLLLGIAKVLDIALEAYMWIIIIRALISWVNPDPYNPIVRFLHAVTDPVLRPVRKVIGFGMGIDISPVVVILGIMFLKYFIVASLSELAVRIKGGGI